jgi:uncharacterized membrane-anchored protein YjiN (DUF445 family)
MTFAGAGAKRARLLRMKTIATALLGVMAIVFVVSAWLRPAYPLLAWLEAFSEAALIGGLADWFAVVALFRHPGGIPLPHTAIVPQNKDRIGVQLGIFVEQNFLTPALITSKLRELDLARHALGWLAIPSNSLALVANVRELVPRLFEAVDDDEVRVVVQRILADEIERVDLSRIAGSVLAIVTAGGAHQRVLARLLPVVAGWLHGQRAEIKRRFAKRSLLTPGFVDAYIVNRFVDGMIDLVDEVAHDPRHPMRREFDAYIQQFVARLNDDPEMRVQAERVKRAILQGGELDQLVAAGWSALKTRLLEQSEKPSFVPPGLRFADVVARIAWSMLDEPAVVDRLNTRLCDLAESVLARFQQQFSLLITEIVQRWDADVVTEKIETELGPDLQFIRLNGSLVGGLAGVVLHAALVLGGVT